MSGEPAYVLPAPELLAKFIFDDGREASFHWSPITNDVIFAGRASDGGAPLFNPNRTMLENYIELAGENAPVPRAIVELDDSLGAEARERALGARKIVDRLQEPVYVGRSSVAQQSALPPTSSAIASCNDAMYFADNHCWYLTNDLVHPNRHDPIWCCDENYPGACGRNPSQGNTMWSALTRDSGEFRKNSYSETAGCGAGVLVRHYFKFAGQWARFDDMQQTVPSDNVYYLFHMGGAWYERRIDYLWTETTGGFRAYSEFTNP